MNKGQKLTPLVRAMLFLVAGEAQRMLKPGADETRNPEDYQHLVVMWNIIVAEVGYYGVKSFNLTADERIHFGIAEHWMNVLGRLYGS